MKPGWRPRWSGWLRGGERLRLLVAALALVAGFAPLQLPWPRSLFEHVVVLDITQSMNVADQQWQGQPIARIDFAKRALAASLEQLPCGSKLGWAVFTEYRSFLLLAPVEVCANRAELRSTLAAMDGRMAWTGNSEVAKGLHSALTVAKALPGVPSVVFITDGQEAPPLSPGHRPSFDDKPGEVAGVLVGVGELKAAPIPKTDPLGRPLGTWAADEVAQVDPRSKGRGASVSGEQMQDDRAGAAATGLGATPGAEHLSALRESYLQLLAGENGFAYHRLRSAEGLAQALQAPPLRRAVAAPTDVRLPLAALALGLLLWPALRELFGRMATLRHRPTPR